MTGPTHEFWQQRFEANEMPWDCGAASPQLGEWLASGALARCRVLVPGCGGGYEVVALARAGFDVTALDYAPAAISLTRERLAQASVRATLVQADALEWLESLPAPSILATSAEPRTSVIVFVPPNDPRSDKIKNARGVLPVLRSRQPRNVLRGTRASASLKRSEAPAVVYVDPAFSEARVPRPH